MRRSPSIVPNADDNDVYLVLNDFGDGLGRAWPEADEERTDRDMVLRDLLSGQYCAPVRVVAFNTAEGWSRDVSEDIAREVADLIALDGRETPSWLESFIERHGGSRAIQLPLPLRGAA
jgi:hypothetical protein